MERKLQGPQPIVFLGKDAELITAVTERLAPAGVEILDFPTVDALTAARCPAAGAVPVLDTETLPEGQDIASLMDHAAIGSWWSTTSRSRPTSPSGS